MPSRTARSPPRPQPRHKRPIQQVEIKGAATAYDARRNDTATKIVVSQEEILKNGDTTLGEVLKRLPGITIGGVQGRGGDIRMRGLGSGYTQILLNGEPAPPGFSLDSISPDMIERIEIMRAATAEYSTQAIAGGINIVLKRAIVDGPARNQGRLPGRARPLRQQRQLPAGRQEGHAVLRHRRRRHLRPKFERPSEIVTEGYDADGRANPAAPSPTRAAAATSRHSMCRRA